jgi:Flp pilus assembly protein TadG
MPPAPTDDHCVTRRTPTNQRAARPGRARLFSHRYPRAERERGSVLVEAAFVFPVLVLLLFGTIDMGAVYNDYISVRQATREGSRQAAVSTIPQPPSGTWAQAGCQTTGLTVGSDAYDLACFTKGRMGLNEANARVSVWFTPQTAPALPFLAGQGVVVCTQYKTGSLTGLLAPLLNNKVLSSQIEIRIEQSSATFTAPAQEPAWTSWPSSCTTP